MRHEVASGDGTEPDAASGDLAYTVANGVARVARAGAYVTGGALVAANGAAADPGHGTSHADSTQAGWSHTTTGDPRPNEPSPVVTFPDLPYEPARIHPHPDAGPRPPVHENVAVVARLEPESHDAQPRVPGTSEESDGSGIVIPGTTLGPGNHYGQSAFPELGGDETNASSPGDSAVSLPGSGVGLPGMGHGGGFGLPGLSGLPGVPGVPGLGLPGTPGHGLPGAAFPTNPAVGHADPGAHAPSGGFFDGVGESLGGGFGAVVQAQWEVDFHAGLDGVWFTSAMQVDVAVGQVGDQLDQYQQWLGSGANTIPGTGTGATHDDSFGLPGADKGIGLPGTQTGADAKAESDPFAGVGTPAGPGTTDPATTGPGATPAEPGAPGGKLTGDTVPGSSAPTPGGTDPLAGKPDAAGTPGATHGGPGHGSSGLPAGSAPSANPGVPGAGPGLPAGAAAPAPAPVFTAPAPAPAPVTALPAPAAPVAPAAIAPATVSPVAATPLQTTIQPDAASTPIANVFAGPGHGVSPLTAPAAVVPTLFTPSSPTTPVVVPDVTGGHGPSTPATAPVKTPTAPTVDIDTPTTVPVPTVVKPTVPEVTKPTITVAPAPSKTVDVPDVTTPGHGGTGTAPTTGAGTHPTTPDLDIDTPSVPSTAPSVSQPTIDKPTTVVKPPPTVDIDPPSVVTPPPTVTVPTTVAPVKPPVIDVKPHAISADLGAADSGYHGSSAGLFEHPLPVAADDDLSTAMAADDHHHGYVFF